MERPNREKEGAPASRLHLDFKKMTISKPSSDPAEFTIVAETCATISPLTVCFVSQSNTEHNCAREIAKLAPKIKEAMQQNEGANRFHLNCSSGALDCLVRYLIYAHTPTPLPPLFPSEVICEIISLSKRLGL